MTSTEPTTVLEQERKRPWLGRARDTVHARLSRVPLRNRLVVITVALLLAAQVITVLATSALLHRTLEAHLDAELRQAATPIADRAAVLVEGSRGSGTQVLASLPTSYTVLFWSTTGSTRRVFLPSTGSDVPDVPRLSLDHPAVRTGQVFEVDSLQGESPWRVVAGSSTDGRYTFAVAASARTNELTVERVAVLSGLASLLAALGCAAGGLLLITRAFRPLRRIEDTAAAIAAGDLTRRVPRRRSSDEIESLSESLNLMLNRIESSFTAVESSEQRMRRFVGDASHELRTPLAAVRGYAELYRQGAVAGPAQVAQVMGRIEGEANRMSGLVEDLLALARLDAQRPMSVQLTDLTVIVMDASADARAIAPDRAIRVLGLGGPLGPALVDGDDARLRQVVTNLVANALHHTPAGTPVELVVGREDDVVRVEVRDHGQGIPAEEAQRVFERFYRHDTARTHGAAPGRSGGSGLGLAIVAAIVAGHDGRIDVVETPGGGATFRLELPAHGTGPPQERHSPG